MSRFFVTGDTHSILNFDKVMVFNNKIGSDLTRDDYLIICGDFGGVWDGGECDYLIQNWLENTATWTTLFVPGNHENYDMLNAYPTEEWCGGRVKFIKPHLICLLKGEVYNINGCKILACGGAASHDKEHRIEGFDLWSEDEIFSKDDAANAIANLKASGYDKVDLVISHTAPISAIKQMFVVDNPEEDESVENLQYVMDNVKFDAWCFGHWHMDAASCDCQFYAYFNCIDEIYDDAM